MFIFIFVFKNLQYPSNMVQFSLST